MFRAYQQHSERSDEGPPDNNAEEPSYHSYPAETQNRRNYDEENRIRQKRLQEKAQEKVRQRTRQYQEDLTYNPVRQEDSDEDDGYLFTIPTADERVCIATPNVNVIHKKHAVFVKKSTRKRSPSSSTSSDSESSERSSSESSTSSDSDHSRRKMRKHKKKRSKKSKKRRKRSKSPFSSRLCLDNVALLFEASEKGSRARFKYKTDNMVKYKNRDGNYEYLPLDRNVSDKLSISQLFLYSYHPDHDIFLYHSSYKAPAVHVFWCATTIIQGPNPTKVHKWTPSILPGNELRQNKRKFKRFYEVKFNPDKYENTFRFHRPGNDEFIPLSKTAEKFKHPWEIKEEHERKQIEQEIISQMRIEALNRGETIDEDLLKIKRKIREEPKVPEHYIDFINCEDQVFGRNRNEGRQTNDKTGLNERKLAILDEGTKQCPQSAKLFLEKIRVLKEHKPHDADDLWKKVLHSFPNNLEIREAYLDFVQYDSQIYTSEKMRNAFKNCRLVLEGLLSGTFLSHECLPGTREFLLKTWIRELHWLFEQGYTALAIASIQASVEISYFTPPICKRAERKDWFRVYWNTGAPRIGDLFYQGGFKKYSPNQTTDSTLFKKLEEAEINKECNAAKNICNALKNTSSSAEGFVKVEREHDNLYCRPLRFPKNCWQDASQEFHDHICDRDYYDFDSLHYLLLENQEVFELFSAFGIETNVSTGYADWFTVARNFGAKLPNDNIAPNTFLILTRIFWQFVQCRGKTCKELYALPSVFVSCAQRMTDNKKEVNKIIFDFLRDFKEQNSANRGQPFIEGLTNGQRELFQYLTLKKMLEHGIFYKPAVSITKALDTMCVDKANSDNPYLFLAFMNLAAEVLDETTFLQNMVNWIGKWKSKTMGDTAEKYLIIKDILMDTIKRGSEYNFLPELMNARAFFPSISSSACSLLIHFYRCINDSHKRLMSTVAGLYEGCKVYSNNDSLKEVHYSFVLYLKKEWNNFHRNKEVFVGALHSHITQFPDDWRVIRISIDYVKSRASTVLPILFRDGVNPLANCFNNVQAAPMYEALAMIALADRKGPNENITNMLNSVMVKSIVRVAELYNSPYLWKAALVRSTEDDFLQTYIKASAQCRWSKQLHMERIRCSGTERALTESFSLMNEANIKLHTGPDDVETYEQILRMRSG